MYYTTVIFIDFLQPHNKIISKLHINCTMITNSRSTHDHGSPASSSTDGSGGTTVQRAAVKRKEEYHAHVPITDMGMNSSGSDGIRAAATELEEWQDEDESTHLYASKSSRSAKFHTNMRTNIFSAKKKPSLKHHLQQKHRRDRDKTHAHKVGKYNESNYLSLSFRSVCSVVGERSVVLVSLLLLQSLSQFILELYEPLLNKVVMIPLFLTMLIGAGGNASNQATVRAIAGLASNEFQEIHYLRVLAKEAMVGLSNAAILTLLTFARVYFFYGHHDNIVSTTLALSLTIFLIVIISALLGASLPFLIGACGFDREHAAPVVQVMMDILGVFITCAICASVIPYDVDVTNTTGH